MSHADYHAGVVTYVKGGHGLSVFAIIDKNEGGKSVTNDAERIIKKHIKEIGDKRVIYCDSEGVWDEILVRNGEFDGFKSLRCRDLMEAIQRCLGV